MGYNIPCQHLWKDLQYHIIIDTHSHVDFQNHWIMHGLWKHRTSDSVSCSLLNASHSLNAESRSYHPATFGVTSATWVHTDDCIAPFECLTCTCTMSTLLGLVSHLQLGHWFLWGVEDTVRRAQVIPQQILVFLLLWDQPLPLLLVLPKAGQMLQSRVEKWWNVSDKWIGLHRSVDYQQSCA